MIDEQGGISVRDLLKDTYEKIGQRNSNSKIIFPNKVFAEIANDSDYHRTRIGYIGYENTRTFKFNGKYWAIARGEKCGDYPGDIYDSDILALELKSESTEREELERKISESTYFTNSLIFAKTDGHLCLSKENRFGIKMRDLLQSRIEKFIAQLPEYDESLFSARTLSPVCTKSVMYKPEFTDFLTDSIKQVLESS